MAPEQFSQLKLVSVPGRSSIMTDAGNEAPHTDAPSATVADVLATSACLEPPAGSFGLRLRCLMMSSTLIDILLEILSRANAEMFSTVDLSGDTP